ncbi:helix-turn-helix transcriptional regulator [Rhodomicrobium vannielii]|nr:helix-turn-helix domain-containing protein [Rhodomicrobium vannielii]
MTAKSKKFLTSRDVKDRLGISDMTLHRWLRSSELKFPRPVVIGRRRFWDESEFERFINARRTSV